jgi:anti-anti-sigma factor
MPSDNLLLRLDSGRLQLSGELDLENAADVLRAAAALDGSTLVIDLSGLGFIDSSGIAVLLRLRRRHPRCRMIGASPAVRHLFAIVGVETLLLDDLCESAAGFDA